MVRQVYNRDYHPSYRGGGQKWVGWMRFVDDPISIAYERRVYATWHEGLVILVVALGANRGGFVPTPSPGRRLQITPGRRKK